VTSAILYGVSPIGLGHASRAAAVGLKLRERWSLEPEFATGGPAVGFLRSYGFSVYDIVSEPVPAESGGEMKMASLWYLRYWRGYRATSKRMAALITKVAPRLIVGDEEFSCLSIAIQRDIDQVMISDELQLGFGRSALARRIEERVGAWYANLQSSVSNLLVPGFGTDAGNIHYMAPMTRDVTMTREETRAERHLPTDAAMVLFSSSGSGIGRFLFGASLDAFRKVRRPQDIFATSGTVASTTTVTSSSSVRRRRRRRVRDDGQVRELGVVRDNQNLIAAADLVISTAGKSTIDECISSGTPLIAIPIRNHAEQERNAAELGFKSSDIERLDELISTLLGKRTNPAHYDGAARTADFLASLLSGVDR
jgi:UDP-N-acetylglucosamine--N-acetylmuramyl-(pentapeptide) pyrophosphoryl-undecaprenol N-acetylglucosamine transferase